MLLEPRIACHCTGDGGLSPQELLAPIDTVVVLCMENRSFDHYLGGSLGIVEGRADIVGLTGSESNPAPGGGSVTVFHLDDMTPEDPPHQWDAVHQQWNMGANDGFVAVHEGPNQAQVMGYYLRDQVPIHHALADAYVVCNHYHCSVLGGTWPNRFYLHAATSNGQTANLPVTGLDPIWDVLADAGVSGVNYHHGVAWANGGYFKFNGMGSIDAFKQAAASGTLPNFSIIDPQFFGGGANDDHPSNANVPLAQLLISDIYTTLAQSPQWNRCLFVVIYDEHGGFYDHVSPPTSLDDDAEFGHVGFRIPALVAGPYVRRGCAVDTGFDHVSVLSTLRTRFSLADLNQRMAGTADLSSCIDPTFVKDRAPQPPVMLPRLDVSQSALRRAFEANGRFGPPGHPQHPELVAALRQQGYGRLLRELDPERTLKRQLDDCVRKGIARLVR